MTKTNYLILLLNFYDNVMVKAFENFELLEQSLMKELLIMFSKKSILL